MFGISPQEMKSNNDLKKFIDLAAYRYKKEANISKDIEKVKEDVIDLIAKQYNGFQFCPFDKKARVFSQLHLLIF